MKFASFCTRIIAGCFYTLFFLVPLVFAGDTSELFEFNKMWLTFVIAIVIGLTWGAKVLLQKRLVIVRTPLDIPILLFLLSQIISSIFSLDQHVSFWGYYSRFNGGLLSTITYVFLYYAFVSNLGRKHIINILQISLLSGLCVALWGLPAHFGYDPTCYVFRGNLDVSCWTDAFQPKVRIFSTLGQPDWMAAYLAVLIPVALAFGLTSLHGSSLLPNIKNQKLKIKNLLFTKNSLFASYYFLLAVLFYVDLLFTRARSGFIALWVALIAFFVLYLWQQRKQLKKSLILYSLFMIPFLIFTFFIGSSIAQIDRFTYSGIQGLFSKPVVTKSSSAVPTQPVKKPTSTVATGELGGTDSGKIRLFVWRGAIEAWLHHPLFGTGVETFAFAYYQNRPAGHNMTSEWDYLYNKAHNEYLNYLATTGIFGLGSYLAIIALFFIVCLRKLKTQNAKLQTATQNANHEHIKLYTKYQILNTGMIAGFISILVSNFFGFSVVIINIYLFLIPLFVLFLVQGLSSKNIFSFPNSQSEHEKIQTTSPWQMLGICFSVIISGYFLYVLLTYWHADKSYAYGYNLDHAGYYQQANDYLRSAVQQKPQEPVYADELSINDAVLASAYAQKDATTAAQLGQEAIQLSTQTVQNHPNNVVYWKTRVRLFYSLSQINQQYLPYALQAIQKANELAPTDAKISYNLGLLYSQTGDIQNGIKVMEHTIQLKPDYKDAYYALSLFYRQAAIDKNGNVIHTDMEQKAVDTMHFILNNFDPNDKQILDALKSWKEA